MNNDTSKYDNNNPSMYRNSRSHMDLLHNSNDDKHCLLSGRGQPSNGKPYRLDPMSDEQRLFYDAILAGHNAIGDACAGSGKSTTILSIATLMPKTRFVQLTYNSMLASEIKQKVVGLELKNIQVFTYHGLVVRYYDEAGHTDSVIRSLLSRNSRPKSMISEFDVLVVDEAQDMTFLYFKLISKFCVDHGRRIQVLVLGDFMQGLYEFKGADTRFLTCADKLWGEFPYLKSDVFHKLTLKVSYRITKPMAEFVNNVMLGETKLVAVKPGEPVVYLRRSDSDAEKYVVHKIKTLLADGASPSDIFILGGSVKGEKSAIRKMENKLVENGIPCFVPMFENDKIDEKVIEGKIVFSTFHSVKGRQRKYVFVMGFDQTYFHYFARDHSKTRCPNTLYVACTRATHGLFIIERNNAHGRNRPLTFLKMNHHEMKAQNYIDFKGLPQLIFHGGEEETLYNLKIVNGRAVQTHYTTPTDLIKFIPETTLEEINPLLETIFVKMYEDNRFELNIPNIIQTQKHYEDVCDLNGIAIPMMYFDKINGGSLDFETPIENGGNTLFSIIEDSIQGTKEGEHIFLKNVMKTLPTNCQTIADYLFLANTYVAVKEKLYFKLKQIGNDEYGWIEDDVLETCFSNMHFVLEEECFRDDCFIGEVEKTIIYSDCDAVHSKIDQLLETYFPNEAFRFTGRIDLITDRCIWELKCVNSLTNDHMLQLVIYAWLWRMTHENLEHLENVMDFKLFNIKTGEILRLNAGDEVLNKIMILLLKGKYSKAVPKKEGDFVIECREWLDEFLGEEEEVEEEEEEECDVDYDDAKN